MTQQPTNWVHEPNHTAPGGRHQIKNVTLRNAPDSLILELSDIARKSADIGKVPAGDFLAERFSGPDMVICSHSSLAFVDAKWMKRVLTGKFGTKTRPESITNRLSVAISCLTLQRTDSDELFGPDGRAQAQLMLNELLLEYPVLMHPRVRVTIRVSGGEPGTCSIPHAIALMPESHFPMESDWPEGEAPLEKLKAFVDSPLVHAGLTSPAITHPGALKEATSGTAFSCAVKRYSARPALLSSLFYLGRHGTLRTPLPGTSAKPALGIYLHDWHEVHHKRDAIHRAAVEADSFFCACGITKLGSRSNIEVAKTHRMPAMFEYIKVQGPVKCEALRLQLRVSLFDQVFGHENTRAAPEAVAHNTSSIVTGLVEAGVHANTKEAAQWMKMQLRDVGAPAVSTELALGFLRALRPHFAQTDQDALANTLNDDPKVIGGAVVTNESWAAALSIESAEHIMSIVIYGTSAPTAVAATPVSSQTRRRQRLGGV